MNKRGQEVGKIITSFPVLIIVFLLVAGGIVITLLFFSLGNSSNKELYVLESPLLDVSSFRGEQMRVIDAIVLQEKDSNVEFNEIREFLSGFVRVGSDNCFIIVKGETGNVLEDYEEDGGLILIWSEKFDEKVFSSPTPGEEGLVVLTGKPTPPSTDLNNYPFEEFDFVKNVEGEERRIYLQSYYGRCHYD